MTIAEEGSFSVAAKKLYITQPSLSQFVRKIEDELGAKLFERTKPLRLTYVGEVYVETLKKIVLQTKEMNQKIEDIKSSKSGKLVIGTTPYCATWILPPVIKLFSEKYPDIIVSMNEALEKDLFNDAIWGKFDFIIAFVPMQHKEFSSKQIFEEGYVLAASNEFYDSNPDLFHTDDGIISLRNFKNERFITMKEGYALNFYCYKACETAGFIPDVVVTGESLTAVHSLVMANIGVALLPISMFHPSNAKANASLKHFKIKEFDEKRPITLSYRTDLYVSKLENAFFESIDKIWESDEPLTDI